MSDTKTVLEQIKDEYAQKEYGYQDWADFLADNRDRPKSVDNAWSEVSRRYATACCKATQTGIVAKIEKVADQYPYKKSGDRESYSERRDAMSDAFDMTLQTAADPDNIVLL